MRPMKRQATAIGLAMAMLAACGKDDGDKGGKPAPAPPPPTQVAPKAPPPAPPPPPPSNEPQSVALADIGATIQAPATWQLKQLNKTTYTFRITPPPAPPGTIVTPPRVIIVRDKAGPKTKSLDAAAKGCPGKVIDKNTLDGGRFYYVCEQTAVGRTVRNFQVIVPIKGDKGGEVITCSGSAADVAELLTACQSLSVP